MGPEEYPESLRMSLFRSAEIVLKSLIALRKKLVSPINARTSLTDCGLGQFLMTSVLAAPGLIPCLLQMSYPRYVILAAPIVHLLGLIFRLCLRNLLNTSCNFFRLSSCVLTEITTSSMYTYTLSIPCKTKSKRR